MALHRFRGLGAKKKKHLFNALVKSALLYPSVAWAAQSDEHIQQLQTVQNIGVNFIGDYSRNQRKRARDTNKEVGLPALTIQLHHQATKVWNKVKETTPRLYQEIVKTSTKLRRRFKPQWPSGYLRTLQEPKEISTAGEARATRLQQEEKK